MKDVLGVDVGGVIMDKVNDNSDTSFFSDNYLATTSTPGVFQALRRLVNERFGGRVYIVSKCGQKVQDKTLNWFRYHNFYSLTGVSPGRVHFCRQRQEKAPICASLGITHFIDDRLEVLSYLDSVPYRIAFQPSPAELKRYEGQLANLKVVEAWDEVTALLL